MRALALSLIFFSTVPAFAQLPPPNLTGSAFRSWIKTSFYDGQFSNLGYSQARRRMYNYIDNRDDTVFCVYGAYPDPVPFGGSTTFPDPINAEHTVPQSFFGGNEPMRADIHHLFPTHMNINSARGNLPFGDIPDTQTNRWMRLATEQSGIPGSQIDSYSEVRNNSRFEPREDHKGDCARAVFYFYTVYPTQAGNITGCGDPQVLYQWHVQDPPSAQEIQRNDLIEQDQGNRNPYIDHPDWVVDAWQLNPGAGVLPAAPADLSLAILSSGLQLSWTDQPDELGYYLYRATGSGDLQPLATLSQDSEIYLDGSVQPDQAYSYVLLTYNLAGESLPSDTVEGILPSAGLGGLATDLLITEYVEGTTFNKALEISNFTGGSINLGQYALVKQVDGTGDWVDTFRLAGVLDDSAVWVIMHPQAEPLMLSRADQTTDLGVMTFNGNDALALLKRDTLLDVVGLVDMGAIDFGLDQTLRRKGLIQQPVAVYDSLEWTIFALDTYADLGLHAFGSPPLGIGAAVAPLPATVFTLGQNRWRVELMPERTNLITISVWDLTGRRVWAQVQPARAGQLFTQRIELRVEAGLYLLRVELAKAQYVQRLRVD